MTSKSKRVSVVVLVLLVLVGCTAPPEGGPPRLTLGSVVIEGATPTSIPAEAAPTPEPTPAPVMEPAVALEEPVVEEVEAEASAGAEDALASARAAAEELGSAAEEPTPESETAPAEPAEAAAVEAEGGEGAPAPTPEPTPVAEPGVEPAAGTVVVGGEGEAASAGAGIVALEPTGDEEPFVWTASNGQECQWDIPAGDQPEGLVDCVAVEVPAGGSLSFVWEYSEETNEFLTRNWVAGESADWEPRHEGVGWWGPEEGSYAFVSYDGGQVWAGRSFEIVPGAVISGTIVNKGTTAAVWRQGSWGEDSGMGVYLPEVRPGGPTPPAPAAVSVHRAAALEEAGVWYAANGQVCSFGIPEGDQPEGLTSCGGVNIPPGGSVSVLWFYAEAYGELARNLGSNAEANWEPRHEGVGWWGPGDGSYALVMYESGATRRGASFEIVPSITMSVTLVNEGTTSAVWVQEVWGEVSGQGDTPPELRPGR